MRLRAKITNQCTDNMFVLDYVPEQYLNGGTKDSVVVFTAGWAMKFVPLLGRALKDMVLHGHSEYALDEFKIDRLDPNSKGKDGKPKHGIIEDPSENATGLVAQLSSLSAARPTQSKGSSIHHTQNVLS